MPVRAVVRENSIWALITRIPDACMWSYARKVVTDDCAKGANAFFEKRDPELKGV